LFPVMLVIASKNQTNQSSLVGISAEKLLWLYFNPRFYPP
jgi:hypothetical protein